MVMTHTRGKCQGQRSLGSKVRRETDGGDCITSRANAVSNNSVFTELLENVHSCSDM